jgi:hypothetical protein
MSQNLFLNYNFLDLKIFKKYFGTLKDFNLKLFNYKVVDRVADYNFDIKFIFI